MQFGVAADEPADLKPIYAGEHQVKDQQVRRETKEFHARIHAIGCSLYSPRRECMAKQTRENIQDGGIVVHDQNGLVRRCAGMAAAMLGQEPLQVGF